jgi:hypothetical protein
MTYTIRQSDPECDRNRVLDLWQRNLPNASMRRYSWLYRTGTATGWLVGRDPADTVGSAGLMERRFRAYGDDVQAGQAIDLNVLQTARSVGPALALQRAVLSTAKQKSLDWVYAFATAAAEQVQCRAGFRRLGTLERWIRPLKFGPALRGRMRNPWLRSLTPPVNSLLTLRRVVEGRHRCPSTKFETTDRFDTRFDALWQTISQRFQFIGERTSTYLRWRFANSPDFRHQIFTLSSDDDQLLAYVVYHYRDRLVYIGDFGFIEPRHFMCLLSQFIRRMRRERIEAVIATFLGGDQVRRRLQRLGFWRMSTGRNALLYVDAPQDDPRLEPLLDAQNWYFTQADVDTDY